MKSIYKFTLIGFGIFALYSFFFSLIVYLFELAMTSNVNQSIVISVLVSLPLLILSLPYVPISIFAQHIGLQPFPPIHNNVLQVNIFAVLISNIVVAILGGVVGFILGLAIIKFKTNKVSKN